MLNQKTTLVKSDNQTHVAENNSTSFPQFVTARYNGRYIKIYDNSSRVLLRTTVS